MDSREKEDALSLTQKALKAQSEDCSGTLPGNAPGSADDAGKKTPDKPQPTHLQTTTSTTKLIHPPVKSFKEVTSMNCTGDAEISLMEMMPFPTCNLPFATECKDLQEGLEIFIPISEDEYKSLAQPWEAAIICKVVGRSFSKEFLRKELQKMWEWKGNLEMTTLGKGFYSIQCPSHERKSEILIGGPWDLLGSHVWVQSWKPGFKPSTAQCTEYPRWVAMPELPIEFYSKIILEKIGNSLGKLLKIDVHSLTGEKKRYAAMCVLMEKAKPLPTGAWIGKNFQQLVFCEGPGYCDVCQNYGHQARHCGQSKNFINAPEQRNVTQKIDGENDREEGQWAEVNRRGGKNNFGLGPRKDMTQLKRWTPKKSTEKVGIKENTKKPEDKNVEREKEAPNVIEKGESSCTISNSFISLQELGDLEGVISEHTQTKVPQEVKGGKPTQPISPKPSHQSPRSLHKTPQGKSCSLSPNKNFQNFTTKKPTPQKNGGPSGDFSHLASASLPTKLTTISTVSAKNLGDQIRPSCPLQSTSQTGDGRIQPGLRGLSNSGGGGGILHRPNMEGSEGNNDQPLPEAGDISKHDTVCELRHSTDPCTAIPRCVSPPEKDESIPQVAPRERGRSRERRERFISKHGAVARPSATSSPYSHHGHGDEPSGETSGYEQYRCCTLSPTPTTYEADGDVCQLGRGKRTRVPARSRGVSYTSLSKMDKCGKEKGGDVVGTGKRSAACKVSQKSSSSK